MFTGLIIVFVLVPMIFAFGALLIETQALLVEVAAADKTGIGAPDWLLNVPLLGPYLNARWQNEFAHPGALTGWTQRTDPTALLAWAQSLGQFMARHVFIVAFTILLLFFLYQRGETLADDFRRVLRDCIGQQAERYIDVATRAVRASVNSMLLVGLFDGLAGGVAYAIAGVPHAALWAAITGALAIVPFLGYVAVAALALQLALKGAGATAALALAMGCVVLICGDKIVRPAIADNGIRLGFVWVLMGCLGGFEALGLVGLVVGPVVISLARELWRSACPRCALGPRWMSRIRSARSQEAGVGLARTASCRAVLALSRQRVCPALREAGRRARQARVGLWPLHCGGRTVQSAPSTPATVPPALWPPRLRVEPRRPQPCARHANERSQPP